MPNNYYGCTEEDLGLYEDADCLIEIKGGASACVLLYRGHSILDPSSQTEVQDAIDNGYAQVIKDSSYSIDPPSAIKSESIIPCRAQTVINYDRTGTYKNPNISATNSDFHSNLFTTRKIVGMIIYECGAANDGVEQVTYINSPLTFEGGRILPGVDTETQRYEGKFSWRSRKDATIHAVPPGIFDF